MDISRLDTSDQDFRRALEELLHWELDAGGDVDSAAREVIDSVRASGDAAVLEYTRRFDRLPCESVAELELGAEDFAAAYERIGGIEQRALRTAVNRVRDYHEHQLESDWAFEDTHGNRLGQRFTAMDRVGVYVPGGQADYPSTVFMTGVPAKVAGVADVVLTVPTPDGERSDLVLAAAHVAGIDRGFTVGGAQAIAALAFGTESIPRVDKIVGPGGVFVTAAKRLVFGQVGIDLIAGPSEVLIIADGSAPPEWLAYDLFSQAEHDTAAQALLLCPDQGYLDKVEAAMVRLLDTMSRASIIRESLARRGGLIRTRTLAEAVEISNLIAPEHLELAVAEPRRLLPDIRHAGAIFLGANSPEVMGDYVAGPSHVLPTYGTARFSSPLGVYDFRKRSSIIELSEAGAQALARDSAVLAHGEGLQAHARSAEVRVAGLDDNTGE
jgi:histidinol dehydrogenase